MAATKTTLIDISNYITRFVCYPLDLTQFCSENKITLPKLDTLRGQGLALMSQSEVRGQKHLTRHETDSFFEKIGMVTTDSIQGFNKTMGLKRINKKGIYCLMYPFEYDMTDIEKRKGCSISGDRNTSINIIKQYWKDNLVDVPNDNWQIGHLDPTIADATEKNLAYQPPIQGKYRDRFKWDCMFQRMWPTAKEWISKMDEYHTETEQKEMLAALKAKWPEQEHQQPPPQEHQQPPPQEHQHNP